MFDAAGFSVPRLLSGLYQLFELCWIKHVFTVWPLTSINQHAKGLDKREMFGDQTPSNIVCDQTFYRLDTLFGAV